MFLSPIGFFQSIIAGTITWNANDKSSNISLSNGNLTATNSISFPHSAVRSTVSASSGKRYYEILISTLSTKVLFGIGTSSASLDNYVGSSNGYGLQVSTSVGNNYYPSGAGGYAASASGDRFMCAVDFDAHKIWFGKNGSWYNSGNPAAGTGEQMTIAAGTYFPMVSEQQNDSVTASFISSSWAYSAPSGFTSF